MSGAADERFTKTPYSAKPHLDVLKLRRQIALLTMFETVVSEFHGRKTPNWTATANKLRSRLQKDTGRARPPGKRHVQLALQKLETVGLVRRYCGKTGALLSQLDQKRRTLALSRPTGLHFRIAGLDYPPPALSEFHRALDDGAPAIVHDRGVGADPGVPLVIAGVRSSEDHPKVDGSLNRSPPLPPAARMPRRLRLVEGRDETNRSAKSEASPKSGYRNDERLTQLLENVNAFHRARGCREMTIRQLVKALVVADAANPGVEDLIEIFGDIFTRHSRDIPERIGDSPVASPLLLMAKRTNLRDYRRSRPKEFAAPPPKAVRLTPEEARRRKEEMGLLFESLGRRRC